MDEHRFDTIGKYLATRFSRRSTSRTLAAGVLAIGLGRLNLDEVVAGCKHVGQKCDKDKDCCAGSQCKGKKCACKRGLASCGETCCPRGEECLAKKGSEAPPICCAAKNICGPLCCPPDRLCVGASPNPIDPSPDPNDLYRCICHDGFAEDAEGNCVCPIPCGDDCCEEEDGEVCCPTARGQKQCVQLASSDNNCGECGHTCPKDRICQNGKCVCAHPTVECDGECIHLNNDHDNCGRCGNQCASNRVCQGGECLYFCEGTPVPDGGCCSDIDCWVYGGPFSCCSGPACDYFDACAYGCVDDTNAESSGDYEGFIICTVL